MKRSPFLFNVESFSGAVTPRRRVGSAARRPRRELPTGVQSALDRLKATLDAIPSDEMERRRLRWEETVAESRRLRH